jgi:hypothetical protein
MVPQVLRLRAGLQNLGCSDASIVALAAPPLTPKKISQQLFGQIRNGQREFESEAEADSFVRVLDAMEFLQSTVTPKVPINWSNVVELKELVTRTVQEKLQKDDPMEPRNWYILLNRFNFLKQINSSGAVGTINLIDAAAFTSSALAQKAVDRLKLMKINADVELLTCPRRRSTLTKSLEEIGFKPEPIIETELVTAAVEA